MVSAAQPDALLAVAPYLEAPGRLSKGERWRALIEYRCKKGKLLGWVISTPSGLVLYSLRRDPAWPGEGPEQMATFVPRAATPTQTELLVPIGGCVCHRLRSVAWDDLQENLRDTPKPGKTRKITV